jgi:hypothetical protein
VARDLLMANGVSDCSRSESYFGEWLNVNKGFEALNQFMIKLNQFMISKADQLENGRRRMVRTVGEWLERVFRGLRCQRKVRNM